MSCREVAERLVRELVESGKCERATIAGSLRRGEESTHDVDVVCADASKSLHTSTITKLEKNGCKVDVFSAHPQHFGAMLLRYTGPKGSNIGMSVQARRKGLMVNQYGVFEEGKLISADWSEDEICQKILGRSCKPPRDR